MISINGKKLNLGMFPDGTALLRICPDIGPVLIDWRYENDSEMANLWYIVSHLRERDVKRAINLYLPYVPNARMDRVKEVDEVFTLKYFARFLNSLAFERVTVRDIHSPTGLALIDRVVQEDIGPIVRTLVKRVLPQGGLVFFPDEGAGKRYAGLLTVPSSDSNHTEDLNIDIAFGIKKRDWRTGRIEGFEVHGTLPVNPFDVLIIDDICSYGGTFLHSARALKELGASRVSIYVSHCEHSILKGELLTEEHGGQALIERVYTTPSIFTREHPRIEILDCANLADALCPIDPIMNI